MNARAIMVLGTSSHVGKSLLTTALCRIFAEEGYRVAPFKSQNMSLNSAATFEGLEIGRAQALQAEAAGQAPSVHMNPILLKPCGGMSSQIIVRGKIWGKLTASEYHQRRVQELMPAVEESYASLAAANDIIILEGAGSPAEINLKQHDIVNMRMAEMADAACVLVGDIDRGGVFASLLGTLALLDSHEQIRIRGFLINKFRGDRALLQPGISMMEQRLQKCCLGIVPFLPNLSLEEEDSVSLSHIAPSRDDWALCTDANRQLRIAVIALPSFSNFTDFDALRSEPSVSLRFTADHTAIAQADILILPGSKQTADDLQWMRGNGLAAALEQHAQTSLVAGVCGGMQMLGQEIADPEAIEHHGTVRGFGLLPLRTQMQSTKQTHLVSGTTICAHLFGQPIPALRLSGYEIHVGASLFSQARCFALLSSPASSQPRYDGCIDESSRIFGTYLHGLFDEDEFRHAFLSAARAFHHLDPAMSLENWKQKREASLSLLADTVRCSINLQELFSWIGLSYNPKHGSSGSGQ